MRENIHVYRLLNDLLPVYTDRSTAKLVMITGARQTGKTTLAKEKYPDMNYINLDAPENREFVNSVSSFQWHRDIGNAVIDEAQKAPLIFDKIKYSYDNRNINFTILLGSSQILLLKNIRESLSGRIAIFQLFPLLMCELFNAEKFNIPLIEYLINSESVGKCLQKIAPVLLPEVDNDYKKTEKHILQWGGMPALLELNSKEKKKWLKDYEYTYLERDIIDLARLNDLEPFSKFKKLTALHSGKLLNYSGIARDTGISVDTARRYLEYLKISYQTVLLQPYYNNVTSSVIKTPKVYWLDTGLLRSIINQYEIITGDIFETMAVSELYKYIKTSQTPAELFFYRTRGGMEIDLIAETPKGLIAFEIKSRDSVSKSDTKNLIEFASALKSKKWLGGIIVYSGNKIEKIAEPDIWAVPSRRLFI